MKQIRGIEVKSSWICGNARLTVANTSKLLSGVPNHSKKGIEREIERGIETRDKYLFCREIALNRIRLKKIS